MAEPEDWRCEHFLYFFYHHFFVGKRKERKKERKKEREEGRKEGRKEGRIHEWINSEAKAQNESKNKKEKSDRQPTYLPPFICQTSSSNFETFKQSMELNKPALLRLLIITHTQTRKEISIDVLVTAILLCY